MNKKYYQVDVGGIYSSNNCGQFRVLNIKDSRNVEIEFLDTGYRKHIAAFHLREGKAVDVMRKSVCGVGYIGGTEYTPSYNGKHTDAYKTWSGMINRCYYAHHHGYQCYGGRGVYVCEGWLNFQNFASWFYENRVQGYHIDKDLLYRGSKVYSPETCCFVPPHINLLVTKKRNTGEYAVGTRKRHDCKGWSARMKDENGSEKHLGMYSSMHLAFVAYKEAKEGLLRDVADKEFSQGNITNEVRDALYNWNVVPY